MFLQLFDVLVAFCFSMYRFEDCLAVILSVYILQQTALVPIKVCSTSGLQMFLLLTPTPRRYESVTDALALTSCTKL